MRYHDHMLYCLLDMVAGDGYNYYFSCWAIFCPFTHITARKIKLKKKHLDLSSFYGCVLKIKIR